MSAKQPEFVSRRITDMLHAKSLAKFGGMGGVRDDGMIESALASAENTWF